MTLDWDKRSSLFRHLKKYYERRTLLKGVVIYVPKEITTLHWEKIECTNRYPTPLPTLVFNEGTSAASFCHQVAALVPDMFWNFYLVKNDKIANNSVTTQAKEKISTDLESLEF
jgi:hypothetical protein